MQNIEQILTSLEVAEMIRKNHKDLIRDIKRYIKQIHASNEESEAERKIAPGDFFEESTYKDSNNQARPCYRITKKGCEFIAHKLTGKKGTEFTARYINRFHEMETELSTGVNQELMLYLKEKLERQDEILVEIKNQTRIRGYLPNRMLNTIQGGYKREIEMLVESSMDAEYLCAVYTFAKHYPNK